MKKLERMLYLWLGLNEHFYRMGSKFNVRTINTFLFIARNQGCTSKQIEDYFDLDRIQVAKTLALLRGKKRPDNKTTPLALIYMDINTVTDLQNYYLNEEGSEIVEESFQIFETIMARDKF